MLLPGFDGCGGVPLLLLGGGLVLQLLVDLVRRLGHVQAHQHPHLLGLPVAEAVNLVLDRDLVPPRLAGGMRFVVDRDRHRVAGTPGVPVERAADHVPVRLVVVKRVGRRVSPDKTVPLGFQPLVEEVVQVVLFDRQGAGGVEEDDVVVLQVLLGEILLAVLRAIDAEQVAADADLGQSLLSRGELALPCG